MNIANVVNDETERKRKLVLGGTEGCGNLLVVGCALVITSVGQHANQRVHRTNEVGRSCNEAVLRWGTSFTVPGNVFVVPG
jgi:hypothetical protein